MVDSEGGKVMGSINSKMGEMKGCKGWNVRSEIFMAAALIGDDGALEDHGREQIGRRRPALLEEGRLQHSEAEVPERIYVDIQTPLRGKGSQRGRWRPAG
jgi:hypothetical protein